MHGIETNQLLLTGFHTMGNINRKWVKGASEMKGSSSGFY